MDRITKMYSNGKVTLEAGFFPPIHQSVIDSEIRNSVPFTVAVERLKEYEDRDCNGCEMCNGVSAINISRAIERQIPKKVIYREPSYVKAFDGENRVETYKCYPCPHCEKWITANVYHKYCQWCGQALDWSDVR